MTEAAEKEPTMEEILASIRRIISEAADEEAASEEDAAPEPAAEAAAEPPAEEAAPAEMEEDVLELTERAEEPEPEPEAEPEEASEPEEPSEPEPEPEPEVADASDMPEDDDTLVSPETELRAGASFAELSAMLVGGYEGAGNTLEGLVREMLKPMLRTWLDENLPRIVEDMVEREVARIAARRGGGRRP